MDRLKSELIELAGPVCVLLLFAMIALSVRDVFWLFP